jgi:hypothetical protein
MVHTNVLGLRYLTHAPRQHTATPLRCRPCQMLSETKASWAGAILRQ